MFNEIEWREKLYISQVVRFLFDVPGFPEGGGVEGEGEGGY